MTATNSGRVLCINEDRLNIDWKHHDDDCFPTDLIFNYGEWRAKASTIATEDE
jgi:hypothetical protein